MINRITPLLLLIGLAFWGCEEAEEPDTTPPTITITSPQDGFIVSDSVVITCMSTDNEGVAKVELPLATKVALEKYKVGHTILRYATKGKILTSATHWLDLQNINIR